MYGKLKNGNLIIAPHSVVTANKRTINPDGKTLASLGFLPVVTTEKPMTDEGFSASAHFEEQDGRIVQVWAVEKIPPAKPTTEERLAALEAAMLEMILGGAGHD